MALLHSLIAFLIRGLEAEILATYRYYMLAAKMGAFCHLVYVAPLPE